MSKTTDVLRMRLDRLIEKTSDTKATTSWWGEDRAGERQALDDLNSGLRLRGDAHELARQALRELDAGKRKSAEAGAWSAHDCYIGFLEAWIDRVKPSERPSISPAGRRGRPKKNK